MLSVQGVSSRPIGQAPIADVSLEIECGELVAIAGPNGAGKSTLCRCLGLLTPIDSGRIVIDATELRGPAWNAVRAGIVVVPKGERVFPELSVRENLLAALFAGQDRRRARLEEVYDLFPVLRTRLAQLAGSMSGGEQQMVAIARAFLATTPYMVFDEPALGLSPRATDDVYRALRSIAACSIGVLVTDESVDRVGRYAHRVLRLERGELVCPLEVTPADWRA